MACILIGWELGGGRGHHVPILEIADELRRRGHAPVLVLQSVDGWPADLPVWQAPLWPGQIVSRARPSIVAPATMGDILCAMGLAEPGAALGVIAAWDRLLAAIDPDLVLTDYAPGLHLAAFGRIPVLARGSGFWLPPAAMASYPSLTDAPPAQDERRLLDAVNAALAAFDRPRRTAAPGIMAADRALTAVFAELDPYAPWRTGGYIPPFAAAAAPAADGPHDEIFVYMNGSQPRPAGFWQGLATCGHPVRVHDPLLGAADRAKLEAAGITTEAAPVPFGRIAARSRMVLSHGGMGFVCGALLAGLPHLVAPYDLEKQLNAAALERLGLGANIAPTHHDAAAFAALLARMAEDDTLHARTRTAAPVFAARMTAPPAEALADAVEEMLGVERVKGIGPPA